MIERFFLKNCLSFEKIDIEFENGLIAFSGASGAGKSVFFQALLSVFGYAKTEAVLAEIDIKAELNLAQFGIDKEEINVFKVLKEKTNRHFINSQSVSKKNLQSIIENYILYLNSKNADEMKSENLLLMLDEICKKKHTKFDEILKEYKIKFSEFEKVKKELFIIKDEEKKIAELREFAQFEVDKINEINPKIGEDEELLGFKKDLSKKEKIEEALLRANEIFNYEKAVNEALILNDVNCDFFDSCMNELRHEFEKISDKLSQIELVNVEDLLERIEKISSLKIRFGSIEEALDLREKRLKEIQRYDNLSFEKKELQGKFSLLEKQTNELGLNLRKIRKNNISELENLLNEYLKKLYLGLAKLSLDEAELNLAGMDKIELDLQSTKINSLSSGEFNRLRLAFIAASNELINTNGGVLILDEIDSNLSGKEAMSVANVLKEISKKYQILAISHQPQLTSLANLHFLVKKENGKSSIIKLDYDQRVKELARMVSGDEIQEEALNLAISLLQS